jgi:hypothetical protein
VPLRLRNFFSRQRGDGVSHARYEDWIGDPPPVKSMPSVIPVTSCLCRQGDFALDAYRYWMAQIRVAPMFHRKLWEYYFISQALYEAGMLQEGRCGLVFGAGQERLPALYAAWGCDIVITDQADEAAQRDGWVETGQHSSNLELLNSHGICDSEQFRRRASFKIVDMNAIPESLSDFDFCWSTCSFEHLGSLAHGLDFVENSLNTLVPGGVAVHTTEFNLSSNSDTFESPGLSLYRRSDIERLINRLQAQGHTVSPVNWSSGMGKLDRYIDLPPFAWREPHLKLKILQYEITTIGLIIRKRPA